MPAPKKGFTLIELLVVIAIIAVLTAIGYSIYSSAQKSALDSRRKSDIDAIAKAYEGNYNAKINKYTSLLASDFVNGKVPTPPEDPNGFYQGFNGGFPAPAGGQTTSQAASFLVCAKLASAPASTICSSTNANCYCKSSSQGGTIASGATPAAAPSGLPGFPTPTPTPSPSPTSSPTPISSPTPTPAAVIYSQSFTSGAIANAQCTSWNAWRSSISASTTYSKVSMSGTNNTTGVSCNGSTANTICQSLRTGASVAPTACDGRSWAVGTCGPSIELSASGAVCSCTSFGYSLRPCMTNWNWGGVNTSTCSGPTQTMTVTCQ